MKELGDALLRSALIVEDTGVMAQVLRTVVRGLNVFTRNTRLALCSHIDEAAGMLGPLVVPPRPGADVRAELIAAVTATRQGYDPQPVRHAAQR